MKNDTEWFDDEDFWSVYAPIIFDDKRWTEVGEVADSITRLAALKLYTAERPNGRPKILPLSARPEGTYTAG